MINLEKQLNWGIKVCFKRKSMIAGLIKIKIRIMPLEFLLELEFLIKLKRITSF